MFKYKISIKNLTTANADSLPPEKKAMLFGMLTLVSAGLKVLPGVTNASIEADQTILVESTQDLDAKFKAMGDKISVSKIS